MNAMAVHYIKSVVLLNIMIMALSRKVHDKKIMETGKNVQDSYLN